MGEIWLQCCFPFIVSDAGVAYAKEWLRPSVLCIVHVVEEYGCQNMCCVVEHDNKWVADQRFKVRCPLSNICVLALHDVRTGMATRLPPCACLRQVVRARASPS